MPENESLPVDTLREALPYLRRPFTPEAVRWKIQTVFRENKGCLVVGYIDARLVIERLNMVAGDKWSAVYQPVEGAEKMLRWCGLKVFGCTRWDVGEGQGATDGMKMKAAVSDALKRAGVHFGIGVSVYALPQITLWANQPHIETSSRSLKLTETGHVKLREGYAKWLAENNRFGDPLDHGDVEGATVDEDAEAEDQFVPAVPEPLDDDRATALQESIIATYAKVDRAKVPEPRFLAWMRGAAHSHDELERLRAYLETQVKA